MQASAEGIGITEGNWNNFKTKFIKLLHLMNFAGLYANSFFI